MIEKTSVLVIRYDEKNLVPLRAINNSIVDLQDQLLTGAYVRRRMIIIGSDRGFLKVNKVRVDPRNRSKVP